jgi:hypothetical protein
MGSKLFHSVVGVGISLGVAACGGAITDDPNPIGLEPDAGVVEPTPDAGVRAKPDAATDDAGDQDTGVEPTVDAAVDAPDDAIVAAFCDVPWPITKSGREVCGPYEECATTEAPWCFGPGDQGACTLYPLECVGGHWHCMGNSSPTNSPAEPSPCQ